jgi:quinol monooxygenase YgiN
MFEATARLTIREGELEGFKEQATEIMRQMKEQDKQPLRYDWFLSDDGTECEVREAYADADSLLEHQHYVAEAKMKLFREFVERHTMTFYGEPSPALAQALQAMGTTFNWFSFLQGLEADVKVLDEVPAYFPGGVWIRTRDGRTLEREFAYQRGAPENPMSPDEVRTKFRENASLVLDDAEVETLEEQVLALEHQDDLRPLCSLLGAERIAV